METFIMLEDKKAPTYVGGKNKINSLLQGMQFGKVKLILDQSVIKADGSIEHTLKLVERPPNYDIPSSLYIH
jgi:hypothetical protein|tara:strand:+ start:2420 stop:2635 length:216 start_codon:yes stop_codon:yes gene_type:complete